MSFLSSSEIALMKSDFALLLNAPEATDVEILYKTAIAPEVDETYGTVSVEAWIDKTKRTRCIQQIVTARSERILAFGILEVGDCVLYLPSKLDLTIDEYSSAVFKIVEVYWIPVPRDRKEFYNYFAYRLGNEQISEVIPCKLKR